MQLCGLVCKFEITHRAAYGVRVPGNVDLDSSKNG